MWETTWDNYMLMIASIPSSEDEGGGSGEKPPHEEKPIWELF